MEEKHLNHNSEDSSQDFGDTEDDDLSLSNLPIHGYDHELDAPLQSRRGSTSSDQDLFEFSGGSSVPELLTRNDSVVFFGKSIVDQFNGCDLNEYRKRDYLCVKAASFHKPRDYNREIDNFRSVSRNRSSSLRFTSSPSPAHKVNITAITSMSAKSRRRMFMFGPVKFKPEMDVVEIKKRQSRRPIQIPPMPEEGGAVVAAGGGGRGKSGGGGDGGIVRPLWCRSHLATVLARSFGCISASIV